MVVKPTISKLNLVRFWLYEHRMPLGFAVAVFVLGALLLAYSLIWTPTGPIRPARGTIVSAGLMSNGKSASPSVTVAVDGGQITLPIELGERCVIGQPVDLLKRTTRLGTRYLFTLHRCLSTN